MRSWPADVASRYMQMGKQEGDPRFNGYAQAAIRPWWEAPDPPVEILRLRAKLKERDHKYDDALADLRLAARRRAARHPGLDRAGQHLPRARQVRRIPQGVRQAERVCRRGRDDHVQRPPAGGHRQGGRGVCFAHRVLPTVREQWPAAIQWMLTMQAEISRSLGRDAQAEEHYREGLANNPGDKYLLRSYADFLLDRGRHEEVLSLLRPYTGDTGILLCLAIAAQPRRRGIAGRRVAGAIGKPLRRNPATWRSAARQVRGALRARAGERSTAGIGACTGELATAKRTARHARSCWRPRLPPRTPPQPSPR